MYRVLLLRFRRRSAVSTMIGGIIILTLLLTALGTMVFVSQQFDSYQSIVNKMSQKDIDRFSENLVAVFPGLIGPTSISGCGGTCNQYNMTISNLAGIGIQVARVYVNSTGSGCTALCVLDPSSGIQSYTFRMGDRYINPGESTHSILLRLPSTILLPSPTPPAPVNTIYITTTRGRVFSFQWPFPPLGTALGGQSGASISTGIMKVAYQGTWDSSKEGSGQFGYCHSEPAQPYPAPAGYKEVLTSTGLPGGSLTFVNPWITDMILVSGTGSGTTIYIYANIINTRQTTITIQGGTLVISTAASSPNSKQFFLGGTFFGTYYKGTFYGLGSSPTVPPNANFYLIFQITNWTTNISAPGLVFTGTAAITNQLQDQTYYAGEVLLDGLYDRTSCTTP